MASPCASTLCSFLCKISSAEGCGAGYRFPSTLCTISEALMNKGVPCLCWSSVLLSLFSIKSILGSTGGCVWVGEGGRGYARLNSCRKIIPETLLLLSPPCRTSFRRRRVSLMKRRKRRSKKTHRSVQDEYSHEKGKLGE